MLIQMNYWRDILVKLFIALLALLAGVASSTQGLYNGYWKEKIDLKTILLVNSIVVLAFVIILYILTPNDEIKFSIDKMNPSILIGGACGFFIIAAFAVTFPSIGALASSLLFIVAFLLTSMLYDYFGVLNLTPKPISFERIAGAALVIFGTFLSLRS